MTSLALFLHSGDAHAQSVTLHPVADATIHAASNGIDEAANGAGPWNFAGWTTRFGERRAMLRFDVAGALPTGSTITGASLTIHVDRGIADGDMFGLHRITSSWNEGVSLPEEPGGEGAMPEAGDVTWTFRSYSNAPGMGTPWTSVGGDFVPAASSQTPLSRSGSFTFASTVQMVSDVSRWLRTPAENHGWMVIGTATMASGTAKRFASREATDAATRPVLVVTYTLCGDVDFNNDGVFPDDRDALDFFDVLAGGQCASCDSIDFNGDDVFPDDRDITAFFNVLAGGDCE